MSYKTPKALEQAVKAAAVKSGRDTNRAIAGFYHDRFLCRVFAFSEPAFVLKGGQSMLAKVADARETRDVDLLGRTQNLDEALSQLKEAAAVDLVDLVTSMLNENIAADKLARRLSIEVPFRHMGTIDKFAVPAAWKATLSSNYRKMAKKAKLPREFEEVAAAEAAVADWLRPVLEDKAEGCTWNPKEQLWI